MRAAGARRRLILAVRFGAGRVLRGRVLRLGSGCSSRIGSGCVLTGCGCVLRTALASISCNSALVGVDGFVILPLFLFQLRGFPGQALSLQSFVIFPESLLLCFVFRCWFPFTGALKSRHQVSSRWVLPCFIAHRSPPISVTAEMTIAQQRYAVGKSAG